MMKRVNKLTTPELVERFTAFALEQDKAIRSFKSAKFNRLQVQLQVTREYLRRREGDQRVAFMP